MLDMRPRGVGGSSSGAPFDATYITQTPNVTLTNEQALSVLATGLLKNTTATGVLSIAVPTVDFASAAQGALADTSLQPGDIGVTVQAWDADLDTLAGLAKADGNFIVGDGAAWVVESGATVRTSLGLGTIATQNANNVTISGGGVTGITDLAIADGGTGQSTAQAAIDTLTNVAAATNEHVLTKDTATGNAIFKAVAAGVTSVFTRTGAVVSANGDYTASQVTNVAVGNIAGVTVQAAINELDSEKAGLALANIFTATQTVDLADGDIILKDITADSNSDVGIVVNGGAAYDAGMFTEVNGTIGTFGINIPMLSSVTNGSPGGFFRLDVRGTTFPTFQVGIYEPTTRTLRVPLNIKHDGRVGIGDGFIGFSSDIDAVPLHIYTKPSTTNAIIDTLKIEAASSGTAAAGFGVGLIFTGESSTTENQDMTRFTVEWVVATHASRTGRAKWIVYDTAAREGIRIEASGTAPMLGFLGASAVPRPATYTLASTATRTMPTPEATFTGQDNAQAGSVYAKSADIITLQTRLDSVEGVLRQLIIDLASTGGYGLLVAS